MIGRLYTWRGQVWLLLVRGEPFDRGPRRNVLLARVARYFDVAPRGTLLTLYRGRVMWAGGDLPTFEGPDGNLWAMYPERVVRPFRGLRRWR